MLIFSYQLKFSLKIWTSFQLEDLTDCRKQYATLLTSLLSQAYIACTNESSKTLKDAHAYILMCFWSLPV